MKLSTIDPRLPELDFDATTLFDDSEIKLGSEWSQYDAENCTCEPMFGMIDEGCPLHGVSHEDC